MSSRANLFPVMRSWFQRGFALLLILAVAVAGNLHLPLVQTIAWARMYSQCRQVYSPEIALSITFSGQYPCKLCEMVRTAEKQRESQPGFTAASSRLLLPLPQVAAIVVNPPVIQSWTWFEPAALVPAGFSLPELPPPRLA